LTSGGSSQSTPVDRSGESDQERALETLSSETDRDVFVYSGPIYEDDANDFIAMVLELEDRRDEMTLLLSSYGGDPHAAYRLGRVFSVYDHVRLLIAGRCKSAGTLIALAADELAIGQWGELGPLDVQLKEPDEMFPTGHSGLDTLQALTLIQENGFRAFRRYVVDLAGQVSTRTAMEIAVSLASSQFEPIAAQLDPLRLGEAARANSIANDYGERLSTSNVKSGALARLVSDYPTHGFVIDRREAQGMFERVDELTSEEERFVAQIEDRWSSVIRSPKGEGRALIHNFSSPRAASEVGEEIDEQSPDAASIGDDGQEAAHHHGTNSTSESRAAGKERARARSSPNQA
jgi:hypothetical protein